MIALYILKGVNTLTRRGISRMVCTYVRDAIFIHWSPLSGAYGYIYSTHRRQSMKYGFRNPSCVNLDNPNRSNIQLNVLKVKQNADLELN